MITAVALQRSRRSGHRSWGKPVSSTGSGHHRRPRCNPWIVAAHFTVSGATHSARPAIFTPLVPRVSLGRPNLLRQRVGRAHLQGQALAPGLEGRDRHRRVSADHLSGQPVDRRTAKRQPGDESAHLDSMPMPDPFVWFARQSGRDRSDELPPDPRASTRASNPPIPIPRSSTSTYGAKAPGLFRLPIRCRTDPGGLRSAQRTAAKGSASGTHSLCRCRSAAQGISHGLFRAVTKGAAADHLGWVSAFDAK
jgi:hypothetical protein